MTTRTSFEDLMNMAFETSGDCPPPEVFLAAEWQALGDDERRGIARHLETCPACSAERELARAFDDEPAPHAQLDPATEELITRLATERAGGGHEARRGGLLPFRSWSAPRRQTVLGFAAAAVLVLAVGIVLRTGPASLPPLPEHPGSETVRGGYLELLAPRGTLAASPEEFSWVTSPEARRYEIVVSTVDDIVLWRQSALRPPVEIASELRGLLQVAVVYSWRVEAYGETETLVAQSDAATFRIAPVAR